MGFRSAQKLITTEVCAPGRDLRDPTCAGSQVVSLWLSVCLCNPHPVCVSEETADTIHLGSVSMGLPWEQTRLRGCAWGLHTRQGVPETESAGSVLNQQPKKMTDQPTPSGAGSPPFPGGSLCAYRCPHGSLLFFFDCKAQHVGS